MPRQHPGCSKRYIDFPIIPPELKNQLGLLEMMENLWRRNVYRDN